MCVLRNVHDFWFSTPINSDSSAFDGLFLYFYIFYFSFLFYSRFTFSFTFFHLFILFIHIIIFIIFLFIHLCILSHIYPSFIHPYFNSSLLSLYIHSWYVYLFICILSPRFKNSDSSRNFLNPTLRVHLRPISDDSLCHVIDSGKIFGST